MFLVLALIGQISFTKMFEQFSLSLVSYAKLDRFRGSCIWFCMIYFFCLYHQGQHERMPEYSESDNFFIF